MYTYTHIHTRLRFETNCITLRFSIFFSVLPVSILFVIRNVRICNVPLPLNMNSVLSFIGSFYSTWSLFIVFIWILSSSSSGMILWMFVCQGCFCSMLSKLALIQHVSISYSAETLFKIKISCLPKASGQIVHGILIANLTLDYRCWTTLYFAITLSLRYCNINAAEVLSYSTNKLHSTNATVSHVHVFRSCSFSIKICWWWGVNLNSSLLHY